MKEIWHLLLYQPILNGVIVLYQLLFANMGLAIIALTFIVRLLLVPLMNPQMESAQKMQELAPELKKLKEKFSGDKQKFAQAQLQLYKEHGVNPASGCLPQILQFAVLIALYQAFNQVIRPDGAAVIEKINGSLYAFAKLPADAVLNLRFLYLDLAKPDLIKIPGFIALPGIFVILATIFQFLSSKMMMPAVKKEEKLAAKTEEKTDDMATSMQKQMLYMFPAMTLIFGYTMPSGVMLYWFIFSLFSFVQQYLINRKKGTVLAHDKRTA